MLQISTTKPAAVRGHGKPPPASKKNGAKSPPIIVAGAPPHPIYGTLEMEDDTLLRQPIFMLNHWHKKAIDLQNEFMEKNSGEAADSSPYYTTCLEAAWDVLNAAFDVKLNNGRDVAALLQMIERQYGDCGDLAWLELEQMQRFAASALKATAPEQPKKRLGALARGRKLTRAGLLFRYQSFLAQELATIGYELYGNPQWALSNIPFDDEVTKRCNADFKDGKFRPRRRSRRKDDPFLDAGKLTARARSVLGALKIDSQTAEERT